MKSIVIVALMATAVMASAPAMASLELAKKGNCLSCHAVDKKMLGPSYQDVAKKYAGDKGAEARLFDRIKKGTAATGGQVWKEINNGSVPMPPNAMVKDDDIKALVKWILAGAAAK